ncbi:MAG: DUF4349 domain-containing protein [Chitinophagales bacterium]|nr:DUF4349 domain-containing protein [Chitinophagales bacterium]
MATKLLFIGSLLFFIGCSNGGARKYESASNEQGSSIEAPAPSTISLSPAGNASPTDSSTIPISSLAAIENLNDTVHRFIRTADIKCKVKNVIQATYKIEDITHSFKGFVTHTHLASEIVGTEQAKLTEDSSIILTHFVVVNDITLRIPNTELDAALKAIAPFIEYMDYRTITAEDVALQIKANRQRIKRMGEFNVNISDDDNGNIRTKLQAEESVLDKKLQADEAYFANLSLEDKIKYSTVKIHLYQNKEVRKEMIANEKSIETYRPSFLSQIVNSMQVGLEVLRGIVVILVGAWPLWIFLFGAWLLYKRFKA